MTQAPAQAQATLTDEASEAALLSAMLVDVDARAIGISMCEAVDFGVPAHAAVFSAIETLLEGNRAVDPITVRSVLAERGELDLVGGDTGLLELTNAAPSVRHAEDYAKQVLEVADRRQAVVAAGQLNQAIREGVELQDAIDTFYNTLEAKESTKQVSMNEGLNEVMDILEGDARPRVRTGVPDLDILLNGGLVAGQLVIVGARPSMGKSAFALGLAYQAAKDNIRTLYVTAEMGVGELLMRLMARVAKIPLSVLTGPDVATDLSQGEWAKIGSGITELSNLPMEFIDAAPSVAEIRARVRAESAKGNPFGLVVIDYLQLLTAPQSSRSDNRQVDVSMMSRGLKVLAREMGCPVVALSQLSRSVDSRADKRPMLSDLRESGSLEQDADVVAMLFRPEMYEPGVDRGVIEVIVQKQRNGPTGTARATFHGEHASVLPADHHHGDPDGGGQAF